MPDEQLATSLASVKEGKGKMLGITLGKKDASAGLVSRQGDGAELNPVAGLNNPKEPGFYQVVLCVNVWTIVVYFKFIIRKVYYIYARIVYLQPSF